MMSWGTSSSTEARYEQACSVCSGNALECQPLADAGPGADHRGTDDHLTLHIESLQAAKPFVAAFLGGGIADHSAVHDQEAPR